MEHHVHPGMLPIGVIEVSEPGEVITTWDEDSRWWQWVKLKEKNAKEKRQITTCSMESAVAFPQPHAIEILVE